MEPDYYAILEVSAKASPADIQKAYRRLARMHHPDLNGQARDAQIKRINEAYAVLGNRQKRAAYDAARRVAQEREQALREAEQARREQLRRAQETARLKKAQEEATAKKEKEMTWMQGMVGFVKELRKELKED
jgi:curved DNA-binding protein CbpA